MKTPDTNCGPKVWLLRVVCADVTITPFMVLMAVTSERHVPTYRRAAVGVEAHRLRLPLEPQPRGSRLVARALCVSVAHPGYVK